MLNSFMSNLKKLTNLELFKVSPVFQDVYLFF